MNSRSACKTAPLTSTRRTIARSGFQVTRYRNPIAARFVALTATNPAKLYGLYPQKGSLAIGGDADITLWDPSLTRPISQDRLNHGADYTPFEGREITGWPIRSLLRGETIAKDSAPVGQPKGSYQSRGTSGAYEKFDPIQSDR